MERDRPVDGQTDRGWLETLEKWTMNIDEQWLSPKVLINQIDICLIKWLKKERIRHLHFSKKKKLKARCGGVGLPQEFLRQAC